MIHGANGAKTLRSKIVIKLEMYPYFKKEKGVFIDLSVSTFDF